MSLKKTFKLSIIAFSLFAFSVQAKTTDQEPSTATTQLSTQKSQASALPDFTNIVEEVENGVVNIRTMETIKRRRMPNSPFGGFGGSDLEEMFRFFFGPDFAPGAPGPNDRAQPKRNPNEEAERTVPSGIGSGFIVSKDGYIITNNHVIDGASKIIVTLNNGKEYTAKVIGTDQRTDIALIKVEAKDLYALKTGKLASLKKGQWVMAIGSPFGLDSTVTAGIISAINRDTGDYLPFIQSDVAVNPGNSGGPLLNLKGEVVGVNSQIISRSGGFMGISLSIPIDEAMKVVDQLKTKGKVSRGRIGVTISEIKDDVAKALGLKDTSGALVGSIAEESPAEKAKVLPGDVIFKFNDQEVKKWSDLPRIVGQTEPGKMVDMEVWRRGKVKTLKIKVEDMSADEEVASNEPKEDEATEDRLGLMVKNIPDDIKDELKLKGGVLVSEVSGAASEAGLIEGDIILVINDQDVKDLKQYNELIKKLDSEKAAALLIRREALTQWVPVKPSK